MFWLLIVAFTLYCVGLSVHRLFWSPISKFPGPKLAALTWWYEFYYDVIKHGQFYKEIERLHSIYGPIIRINPNELHVKDPDWYNVLFAGGSRVRDKSDWFLAHVGTTSMFGTVPHAVHRKRRASLSPFFSKYAVANLEPVIQEKVDQLSQRLHDSALTGELMQMDDAYMALTLDIVSHYGFGESFNLVQKGNFGVEWKRALHGALEASLAGRHMPWIPKILDSLPESIQSRISEPFAFFLGLKKKIKLQIQATLAREHGDIKTSSNPTIFEELRDSDLPWEEKTVPRLLDEGLILIVAGSETTARTLTTLTFHLLNTPAVLKKLVAELDVAIPDTSRTTRWQELEQLPYLRATIVEAHRITSLMTTRLIRVAPDEVLEYMDWRIPAGTPVSMTTHWTHHDPSIFTLPFEFRPERFISETPELEKYVVPFSKGSRGCIGLNLASAELFLTVAYVFRRFELQLYETKYEDIQITWDGFSGGLSPEAKGVRMRVLRMRD